jgi:Hydantoinase/oxoprolinase C-terminal domain
MNISMTKIGQSEISNQGINSEQQQVRQQVYLRYAGTDAPLLVDFASDIDTMRSQFEAIYQQRYGFTTIKRDIIIESAMVEAIGTMPMPTESTLIAARTNPLLPRTITSIYTKDNWYEASIFDRSDLCAGDQIIGPAIIIEPTGTNIIEPDWVALLTERNHLILTHEACPHPDPLSCRACYSGEPAVGAATPKELRAPLPKLGAGAGLLPPFSQAWEKGLPLADIMPILVALLQARCRRTVPRSSKRGF